MNSRERVLTTVNHKEPDRVPLFFNAIDAKFVRAIGQGNMIETWKRLGVDVFVMGRTTWCEGKPSALAYSPNPPLPRNLWVDRVMQVGMGLTSLAGNGGRRIYALHCRISP